MTSATFASSSLGMTIKERRRLSNLATIPAVHLLNNGEASIVGHLFNTRSPSKAVRTFAAMVATACVLVAVSSQIKHAPSFQEYSKSVQNDSIKNEVVDPVTKLDVYESGHVQVHVRNSDAEAMLQDQIARTWKISSEMSKKIVNLSFKEGIRSNIDPLLVLSIIAVESSFKPSAHSAVGAEGVMQVWRKWHKEKFEQEHAKDPIEKNIKIGIKILKENLKSSENNFREALQRYNGTKNDAAMKYSGKVLEMHASFKGIYETSMTESNVNQSSKGKVAFILNENHKDQYQLSGKVQKIG